MAAAVGFPPLAPPRTTSTNMIGDKSMLLKVEDIIVLLFISYVMARRVVDASCLCLPVAAAASGQFWHEKNCGDYIGIFLYPLFSKILNIFDEHLQNQIKYDLNVSASPNISPWRLCPRPPDHNRWKAESLSFLHVVLLVCEIVLTRYHKYARVSVKLP